MVLSVFAYLWRQFNSKLISCSARIWSNCAARTPKWQKCVQKLPMMVRRLPSGNWSSDTSRGGPKLWNEFSYIKIGQELTSEMRKMWGNLKFLHDHDKFSQLHQITCFGVYWLFFTKFHFLKKLTKSTNPTRHYYFDAKICTINSPLAFQR